MTNESDRTIEDQLNDPPETQSEPAPADSTQASELDSIESLRQKLDEAEKRALRFQADLENFRRRKSKETQDMLKYAALPLIGNLLEVIDNLDRAIESSKTDENIESLRQGVDMVSAQLLDVLKQHGCQRIESTGQPFDPNQHEAIQMQPSDEVAANHVILEAQSGYKMFERVVRPAKVLISTGSQQD